MSTRFLSLLVCALVTCSACSRDARQVKAEHVANGDRYVTEKNYSAAAIEYRNAIALDARDGDARLKLAHAYESLGEPKNAYPEYIRAADLLPDNVDAQMQAGRMLLSVGQYPEARARAMTILTKEPTNVNALI